MGFPLIAFIIPPIPLFISNNLKNKINAPNEATVKIPLSVK